MDTLIIRTAKVEDIEQLKEYEQGVISAERPFDNTFKKDNINYYDIASLISDPSVELAVAELNHQLVACGYAKIVKTKPYIQYPFYSYLGFMFVAPQSRGLEVNKRIISYLAQWSKEQGVYHMHLDVYRDNEAAIRAYEKCGFRPYLMEMRCDLKH
jgi:GNAT superfamily N-acetyltransferase